MVNPTGCCLGIGPSDPVWIVVKLERQRDRKIPHNAGGEIEWHPCLFWPSDWVEVIVKSFIICLSFLPTDLRWIVLYPGFY